MQVIKDYTNWFIAGAAILALVLFNYFFIGAMKERARREHEDVISARKKINRLVTQLKDFPTAKDLASGAGHLAQIRAEGLRAGNMWYRYTHGLNASLENGQVIDPASGRPVDPLLFSEFMIDQYRALCARMENALAQKMRPEFVGIFSRIAAGKKPVTAEERPEEIEEYAQFNGEKAASYYAHIYQPSELIPVRVDEDFSRREKRWETWRRYLILQDVLGRVLLNSDAQVEYRVRKYEKDGRVLDENWRRGYLWPAQIQLDVVPVAGRRFVERLVRVEISTPILGNGVLPAPDLPEKEAELKETPPEGVRYYDTFTLTIELVAHNRVVDNFMRQMVASRDFYYVPIAAEIERYVDTVTMGYNEMPPIPRNYRPRPAQPSDFYETKPPAEILQTSGLYWEPPVRATLVYRVYRFRFTDTPNQEGGRG